jgi:methionyl-tRNA formyltransferase
VRVLLVGEESAGIQVLRSLAGGRHKLVAVLTTEPTRGGGSTVSAVADSLGVRRLPSEAVVDGGFAGFVEEQQVDLLLNVHSLFLVHPDVVRAPRIGSFNLHPGPLPEYAGLNAPSWAIYNGEQRHAVTLHWMDAEIDTGWVAYTASFDLTDRDTGLSVSARCVREGVPLIERLLEDAAADPATIPRTEQNLARRRYYRRAEVPDGGKVDWGRSARRIVDLVRASDYLPFPSPWGIPSTLLDGSELGIAKAARSGLTADAPPGSVRSEEDGALLVAASDEWVRVQRVFAGGKIWPAGEVLTPGSRLGEP